MTGYFNDHIEGEPDLSALLADPLTHRVMARDGVTEADVRAACARATGAPSERRRDGTVVVVVRAPGAAPPGT